MLIFLMMFWQSSIDEQEINALICQDANRSFLISCLAIAATTAIVGAIVKWYLDQRLKYTPGTRMLGTTTLVFVISSLVVAWNPMKTDVFLDCLASNEFSRFIFMAHVAPLSKGLVLGGTISSVLFFTILAAISFIRGR